MAGAAPVDLRGAGQPADVVFTARAMRGRNPGCRPGVFWLEPAFGPGEWTEHVIDEGLAHPLHVAVGDLSGDGHGQDVVVGDFTGRELTWYRRSSGFARHALPLPAPGHAVFNTAVGRVSGGPRDDILVAQQDVGVFLYVHGDGGYRSHLLFEVGRHPLDDRVLWHDLDGDGRDEAVVADSGGDRLLWLDFV